jgi:hypothetical protein
MAPKTEYCDNALDELSSKPLRKPEEPPEKSTSPNSVGMLHIAVLEYELRHLKGHPSEIAYIKKWMEERIDLIKRIGV